MKRLLLIAALAASLLTVAFCHHAGPSGQEVTVQTTEQAPVETPSAPVVISPPPQAAFPPVHRVPTQRVKAKQHRPVKRQPKPIPLPPPPVEDLPPQQGAVCIFPFNMIPTCTPGVP